MGSGGEGFDRRKRLRRRSDYLLVQNRGRRVTGSNFMLFYLPRERDGQAGTRMGRLGVTVSKKVGGAVARNLVKRRLREIYRRSGAAALAAIDMVVVARPGAAKVGFEVASAEVRDLLYKVNAR